MPAYRQVKPRRLQLHQQAYAVGDVDDAVRGAGQVKLTGVSVNPTTIDSMGSPDTAYAGCAGGQTDMFNTDVPPSVEDKRIRRSSRGSRVFYASKTSSDEAQAAAGCIGVCLTSVITDEVDSSQLIAEKIAPLRYIPITINGIPGTHAALHDSGSQVNLIRRSLLSDDDMKSIGRIAIRGAFGAPVQTDVVMFAIKPAVLGPHEVNIAPACDILFAVCDEVNEQVILTADTVQYLNSMQCNNEAYTTCKTPLSGSCSYPLPTNLPNSPTGTRYREDGSDRRSLSARSTPDDSSNRQKTSLFIHDNNSTIFHIPWFTGMSSVN